MSAALPRACDICRWTRQLAWGQRFYGIEYANRWLLASPSPKATHHVLCRRGAVLALSASVPTHLVIDNAVTGDYRHLAMGEQAYLGKGCFLDLVEKIEIADEAAVSGACVLLTHGDPGTGRFMEQTYFPRTTGPIRVGRRAWIGAGAVVLPGVTVGECSVVGAGSVVRHDVEPYTVVAGVPARTHPPPAVARGRTRVKTAGLSVAQNSAITLGANLTAYALTFGASIIVARSLGPAGKGAFQLVVLAHTLLATLGNLGLAPANSFLIAKGHYSLAEVGRHAAWLSIGLGMAVFLLTAIIVQFLPATLVAPEQRAYVLLAGGLVPFALLTQFLGGVLQGAGKIVWLNVLNLAQALVYAAGAVVFLLLLHLDVPGALITFSLSTVTTGLLALLVGWRLSWREMPVGSAPRGWNPALVRQASRFGIRGLSGQRGLVPQPPLRPVSAGLPGRHSQRGPVQHCRDGGRADAVLPTGALHSAAAAHYRRATGGRGAHGRQRLPPYPRCNPARTDRPSAARLIDPGHLRRASTGPRSYPVCCWPPASRPTAWRRCYPPISAASWGGP